MPEHPHFARFYERMIAGSERAGLARMRHDLLATAEGRTLEVGAGTGLNLPSYPSSVASLTLTEPDPHMARRLRERLAADGPPAGIETEMIYAGAEALPFEDGSFDTVVSTLVLCAVPSSADSLKKIRRVLAEGGSFLYLEHVRGQGPVLSWWQDRLNRPWGAIAGGCNLNRPTGDLLAEAGFDVDSMERTSMPKAPPWVRPMIRGRASR
ncbi:class I SAM-dependent methyltransferase [soil metagenome]